MVIALAATLSAQDQSTIQALSNQVTALALAVSGNVNGGWIPIVPSGNPSTDTTNLKNAVAQVASNTRTVLHTGNSVVSYGIMLCPGPVSGTQTATFTFNDTVPLGTGGTSTQIVINVGLQIRSGPGVTCVFAPASPRPMFINQMNISPVIDGWWLGPDDGLSDFLWSQEQAGQSHIQNAWLPALKLQNWRHCFRLTGGNNNSEWKFDQLEISSCYGNGFYTPPPCNITSSASSTALTVTSGTSGVADLQVGDTITVASAMAPLTAGQQVFVLSATQSAYPTGTTGVTVATTYGGAAVSFTGATTSSANPGSDQFLNFWGNEVKWNSNNGGLASLFSFYNGGSIGVGQLDISGWSPTSSWSGTGYISGNTLTVLSTTAGALGNGDILEATTTDGTSITLDTRVTVIVTAGSSYTVNTSQTVGSAGAPATFTSPSYAFNLLGTPSSRGVCSIELHKVRAELKTVYARLFYSRWTQGIQTIYNVDIGSSRAAYTPPMVNFLFNYGNNAGPKTVIKGGVLIGKAGVVTNSATFNFKPRMEFENIQSLDWDRPSDFMITQSAISANTGGLCAVRFKDFDGNASSSGLYKTLNDCTLNFFKSNGGSCEEVNFSIVGANSDMPNTAAATNKFQVVTGTAVTRFYGYHTAGTNTGPFSYNFVDGNGTVMANWQGTNAANASTFDSGLIFLPITTDTQSQIQVVDVANAGAGRAGAVFTGVKCFMAVMGG